MLKSVIAAALLCTFVVTVASLETPFAGVTKAVYSGAMTTFFYDKNGYDDARLACDKEFNGTHVCTDAELGWVAQVESLSKGSYRYVDMSFAEDGERKINNCLGFTSAEEKYGSYCIRKRVGGPVVPEFCPCGEPLPFICCKF